MYTTFLKIVGLEFIFSVVSGTITVFFQLSFNLFSIMITFPIHLDLGLSIDSGLHIKKIEPGSAAAEEETLSIGDKILTVRRNICFIYLVV